jgi:hypothetical protein
MNSLKFGWRGLGTFAATAMLADCGAIGSPLNLSPTGECSVPSAVRLQSPKRRRCIAVCAPYSTSTVRFMARPLTGAPQKATALIYVDAAYYYAYDGGIPTPPPPSPPPGFPKESPIDDAIDNNTGHSRRQSTCRSSPIPIITSPALDCRRRS